MLSLLGDTEARLAWSAALRILDSTSHLKWTSMLSVGARSKMSQGMRLGRPEKLRSDLQILEMKPDIQKPIVPGAEQREVISQKEGGTLEAIARTKS